MDDKFTTCTATPAAPTVIPANLGELYENRWRGFNTVWYT